MNRKVHREIRFHGAVARWEPGGQLPHWIRGLPGPGAGDSPWDRLRGGKAQRPVNSLRAGDPPCTPRRTLPHRR